MAQGAGSLHRPRGAQRERPSAAQVQLTGDLHTDILNLAAAHVTPVAQPSSTPPALPEQTASPAPVVADVGATGVDAPAVAPIQQGDVAAPAPARRSARRAARCCTPKTTASLDTHAPVRVGAEDAPSQQFVLRAKAAVQNAGVSNEAVREAPAVRAPTAEEVAAAAAEAHTAPTEAQQDAGNYQKGHVSIQGLNISIENPKGSTRSGTDGSGKSWSVDMAHHYGYIKARARARDKDHVDVFVGAEPREPEGLRRRSGGQDRQLRRA
jgi:hypothetical protein